MMNKPAILALEDGTILKGLSVGIEGTACGEVVFNTAMSGYQEILSDPSYTGQMITFTCPHIGNVGVNDEDCESHKIWASGVIMRDYANYPSNWRAQQSLMDYFIQQQVIAISDIDTRFLTHRLRSYGSMRGCIMAGEINEAQALEKARSFSGIQGLDCTQVVSTDKLYHWPPGYSRKKSDFSVIVYDFGVKKGILQCLRDRDCSITVVPARTSVKEILNLSPDGIVLSNGPGDPAACADIIEIIRQLLTLQLPILGICFGHQLLALACGAKTVKMKFGHHGANHPVLDLENEQVLITAQNHGFRVDEDHLPADLEITHRSLFDQTIQGFRHQNQSIYSFQGHPEASPGPEEGKRLFEPFILAMKQMSKAKQHKVIEQYAKTE